MCYCSRIYFPVDLVIICVNYRSYIANKQNFVLQFSFLNGCTDALAIVNSPLEWSVAVAQGVAIKFKHTAFVNRNCIFHTYSKYSYYIY